MKKLFSFIMIACLLPLTSKALDAELYDPTPPANSAFIRIIHAASEISETDVIFAGRHYPSLTYPAVSSYLAIPSGKHLLNAGDFRQSFNIAAGSYYSIALLNKNKLLLVEDEPNTNPAKARIYFYNFSDAASASIYTPEHNAYILKEVTPNTSSSRQINALTLNLQLKANGKEIHDFSKVQLKRRKGITALLTGNRGNYSALLSENTVTR